MKTAHYYASRTHKKLVIEEDFRTKIEEIEVSGKVEARKIAADRGAKCWNF